MATVWSKVFSRINWQNKPSTATPINATNLNANDYALDTIDDRVIELNSRINDIEPQIADVDEAIKQSKEWAVGPSGTGSGTDTNNSKYWAEVAKDAADAAIINLGKAGYIGFRIDEKGHLILTKSSVLEYLDFDLDDSHKDLIVTVTEA